MTFLLGLLLTLNGAMAADNAVLKTVESQATSAGFAAVLSFDRDFSPQVMIDYQKDYIQVDLKGQARVDNREVVRVADKEIQSIVISQFAPDVIRARLVLREAGDPARFKGRIKADAEGSLVKISMAGAADAAAVTTEAIEREEARIDQAVSAQELLASELQTEPPAAENAGFMETAGEAEPAPVKTEAEIPVLDKMTKSAEKAADPVSRLFISLAVIAAAAIGILAFARFYAKRRPGLSQNHQIKVLTQYGIGPKKSLAIIRVAGESILIGVTDHNISMIKSLAMLDEDLPLEVPARFDSALETAAKTGDREDFSFGSVKDMVASRLREMRSL